MNDTAERLIDEYLHRLERELAGLPRARRRELVDEIGEHIAEARAGLPVESEAEIRTLLDRIGDPTDIAAEARGRMASTPPTRRASWHEVAALILLPVGGLVLPLVGWVAGVVLLWTSDAWSARDKLIGTLLLPGGLGPALVAATFAASTSGTCVDLRPGSPAFCTSSGASALKIAALVALAVLPLASVLYLALRLRRANVHAAAAAA